MSVADVTNRIQQIQSQLAMLQPVRSTSGAAFSSALTEATAASSATVTTGDANGVTGNDVVGEAKKYLGLPYVWGGTDPKVGLDCSGLVQLVYKNLGVDLPRVSYQQATEGRAVPSMAQARPGDLLAFGSPSVNHIAIYIGGGKMIHAPRTGKNVEILAIEYMPYMGAVRP